MKINSGLITLALIIGSFYSIASPAAERRRVEGDTHPSFAGVWDKNGSSANGFRMMDASLYVPKYAEMYKKSVEAVEAGTLDLGANCSPPGPVRSGELGQFEVLNAPEGRITILYEFMTQIRRFYIDGKFPEHVDPSVNGYSVARWEGKTLVVETRGIGDFSYLDRNAAPHSDRLRLIERFSLLNPDLMSIAQTIEDPIALTRPWQSTLLFKRVPNGELIDYECSENPRNPINPDGTVGYQ